MAGLPAFHSITNISAPYIFNILVEVMDSNHIGLRGQPLTQLPNS